LKNLGEHVKIIFLSPVPTIGLAFSNLADFFPINLDLAQVDETCAHWGQQGRKIPLPHRILPQSVDHPQINSRNNNFRSSYESSKELWDVFSENETPTLGKAKTDLREQ
jgi:hypothetical protein